MRNAADAGFVRSGGDIMTKVVVVVDHWPAHEIYTRW
jgi:hypothetical protein